MKNFNTPTRTPAQAEAIAQADAYLRNANLTTYTAMLAEANATAKVPALDCDRLLVESYNQKVSVKGKLERRIVANLLHYLQERGFAINSAYDTDEQIDVNSGRDLDNAAELKAAMEFIFARDMAYLLVAKRHTTMPEDDEHYIYFVLGNETGIVSDWSFSDGDRDDFNKAMEAFDADQFA